MSNHAWCSDVARYEAVRAAEDGRQGPLPTLEEAIADPFTKTARICETESAVEPVIPAADAQGGGVAGLRTERVTPAIDQGQVVKALECLTKAIGCYGERIGDPFSITWSNGVTAHRKRAFVAGGVDNVAREVMRLDGKDLRTVPNESVRVVEECCLDRINMGEVIRERDAAIRERNAAKEECERLLATVAILERRYLRCVDLRDADGDTIATLKARVAELEFDEVSSLRAEIARLREERRRREALWLACADETRLVYGGVFRPQPLPPGPEGDGKTALPTE